MDYELSGMQPRSLLRSPEGTTLPNGMTVHSMQDLRETLEKYYGPTEPSDFAGEWAGIKIYEDERIKLGFYRLRYPLPFSGEF